MTEMKERSFLALKSFARGQSEVKFIIIVYLSYSYAN